MTDNYELAKKDSMVKEIMLSFGKNDGYYSVEKLFRDAPLCRIAFIAGKRRIGKTLLALHTMCELYQQFGFQTIWVRNKKVELQDDGFCSSFLNAAHRLNWCPPEWWTDKEGVHDQDGNIVCLFQSISTYSNRRGNETAEVRFMFFDEYMPEDRRYPKGCHKGLMSLIKTTMASSPESFCMCASNFIESSNPYWLGYGIYPFRNSDISVFSDGKIAIEICRDYRESIEKDNPWHSVFKTGGYADYSDQNEDALFQLVKNVPKGSKPASYVIVNDGRVYRSFDKDGFVYWASDRVKTGDAVFTPNLVECKKGTMLLPDVMKNDIKWQMGMNALRFANPNVMRAILGCVYQTL